MQDIKKHLLDNEEILWEGAPGGGLLEKHDIITIPFTLIVFGGISFVFTLFLLAQMRTNPALAFYFLICGLLVYIISFFFIFGRFLYRNKQKKATRFFLTSKRALVLENDEIYACFLENASPKIIKNNIYFAQENPKADFFYNLALEVFIKRKPDKVCVFSNIDNPEKILNIIKTNKEGDGA